MASGAPAAASRAVLPRPSQPLALRPVRQHRPLATMVALMKLRAVAALLLDALDLRLRVRRGTVAQRHHDRSRRPAHLLGHQGAGREPGRLCRVRAGRSCSWVASKATQPDDPTQSGFKSPTDAISPSCGPAALLSNSTQTSHWSMTMAIRWPSPVTSSRCTRSKGSLMPGTFEDPYIASGALFDACYPFVP